MKSRRYLPLALFSALAIIVFPPQVKAQPKIPEEVYAFDQDMKATSVEKAKYFLSVRKFGDTVWQWDTYNFTGPIIRMQTYSDHDGKVLNGPSYFYTDKGDLDSIAEFKNGLKEGTFYHMETSGNGPRDSLVWKIKYQYKNDLLIRTDDVVINDMNDSLGDKESIFPGGLKKWVSYLSKTLEYPDRAAKEQIQGLVRALFTVDKTGKVGEIYLGRSVEYSLDREVERVIRNSGKWEPGMKAGVAVKTWKIQPVNMKMR